MENKINNAWDALCLAGEMRIGILRYRLNDGELEVYKANPETWVHGWQVSAMTKEDIIKLEPYMYDVNY